MQVLKVILPETEHTQLFAQPSQLCLGLPLVYPNLSSPLVTSGHRWSQLVTAGHRRSPLVTSGHLQSPPVTCMHQNQISGIIHPLIQDLDPFLCWYALS